MGESTFFHVKVNFNVICNDTKLGETVGIVGDAEDLGNWNPEKCVRLSTGPNMFPLWQGYCYINGYSRRVEYKLGVIKGSDRASFRWEPFEGNRMLLFRESGEITVSHTFGVKDQYYAEDSLSPIASGDSAAMNGTATYNSAPAVIVSSFTSPYSTCYTNGNGYGYSSAPMNGYSYTNGYSNGLKSPTYNAPSYPDPRSPHNNNPSPRRQHSFSSPTFTQETNTPPPPVASTGLGFLSSQDDQGRGLLAARRRSVVKSRSFSTFNRAYLDPIEEEPYSEDTSSLSGYYTPPVKWSKKSYDSQLADKVSHLQIPDPSALCSEPKKDWTNRSKPTTPSSPPTTPPVADPLVHRTPAPLAARTRRVCAAAPRRRDIEVYVHGSASGPCRKARLAHGMRQRVHPSLVGHRRWRYVFVAAALQHSPVMALSTLCGSRDGGSVEGADFEVQALAHVSMSHRSPASPSLLHIAPAAKYPVSCCLLVASVAAYAAHAHARLATPTRPPTPTPLYGIFVPRSLASSSCLAEPHPPSGDKHI
eukprot:CAMPEP_0196657960 /NCGR_PEP_ID=MMETSP1086-20130531/26423_1 /TAXON_ID=77921 /ORGANISM="Cyanoptyche  gloeocystis , Strain SAG4.97" /LENGTH=531 /DNA_ID=CAMNT_0041991289 /DNA_START=255 /DNA_END=1851 /DNA_ORIENTATION=+